MLKPGLTRIRPDVLDQTLCCTAEGTTDDGQEQILGHSGTDYTSIAGNAQIEAKANRLRVGKGARRVVTALVQVGCFTHADSSIKDRSFLGLAAKSERVWPGRPRGWGVGQKMRKCEKLM
jgi:hypothetical protein